MIFMFKDKDFHLLKKFPSVLPFEERLESHADQHLFNNLISSQVMLKPTLFCLMDIYTGGCLFLITAQQRHHLLLKIGPCQHKLHLPQLTDAE